MMWINFPQCSELQVLYVVKQVELKVETDSALTLFASDL